VEAFQRLHALCEPLEQELLTRLDIHGHELFAATLFYEQANIVDVSSDGVY
jgi:hypothetical protein